jgi:hypothetical protein
MYDIRQFKPVLYFLLVMGMSGFALAFDAPGVWLLSVGGMLLNAWLVKTGRFRPLPRLLANGITILALLYVGTQFRLGNTPVQVIGHFLVLLQLVKLYEQRGNRDYAQLLVLSLLLMVAASINTASLLFGMLLIAYLFVSLYCCLLFHLKVESDLARAAIAIREENISPATLRQDQRYLSRSMRRLTGLVSGVSITAAILVFLLFPRGTGAGLLGPLQMRITETLTGFNDNVSFQDVAKITQNNEVVAYVKVWKNDQPVAGTEQLLLRGGTLQEYGGLEGTANAAARQWARSRFYSEDVERIVGAKEKGVLVEGYGGEEWRQSIQLLPTGAHAIFAIGAPISFKPGREVKVRYSARDGILHGAEPIQQRLDYEVVSRAELPVGAGGAREYARLQRVGISSDPAALAKVRPYAQDPEVSGRDAVGGALYQLRGRPDAPADIDERIAGAMEQHLRTKFTYTLDLTDQAKLLESEDPLAAFLLTTRRGHCEYFAGAMTLMCQSLGMQARMVIGFKCDEFNQLGGYYIVRQSHAHAWVEVLTPRGWLTFDPTSSREDTSANRATTFWERTKHLFNFLEYKWANSVVAYDSDNRDNLVGNLETRMTRAASRSTNQVNDFWAWLKDHQLSVSSNLLAGLVGLMLLGLIGAVAWYVIENVRLRRRAAHLGLAALPAQDQARLVRQLGFYEDLSNLLHRHRIVRPPSMTPMEFADSLSYLSGESHSTILRLTHLFYRIRFGRAELKPALRRRVGAAINKLATCLADEFAPRA